MSAHRLVTLTCDGCGQIFDLGINPTVSECRARARQYGWTKKGRSEDYCSHCSKET